MAAEAPQITGVFTLWESGAEVGDFDVVLPSDRYFVPDALDAAGILYHVTAAAKALSASSGGGYTWETGSPQIPDPVMDPAYGIRYAIRSYSAGVATPLDWEFEPQDANATRIVNWLGWETTMATAVGILASDMHPLGCWFPFAHLSASARFSPLRRHGGTSPRTADGTFVGTQFDDGVAGYVRAFRFVPVDYARIASSIASTPYASLYRAGAGVTGSSDGGYPLDIADGWWDRTCLGGQFYFVDAGQEIDEGVRYRIALDGADLPISMDGWRSLSAPNVTPWAPVNDMQAVQFSAIEVGPL